MTTNTEIYSSPDKFREHLQTLQTPPTENPIVEQTEVKEVNNETHAEEAPVSDEETPIQESINEDESSTSNEAYKENKFIPKSRFNEVNKRNKELEEFAASERDARIRLETQLQMMQEQFKKPEAQTPQVADLEHIDPLDHEAHQVYWRKIKELESKVDQVTRSATAQTQMLQKENIIKAQKDTFEKNNPDYKEALEYLKKVEMNVAKNFYKSDREAEQALAHKYNVMAEAALNNQHNVPEVFYNIAKSYGYSETSKKDASPKGTPNIDAINKNMAKTASIGSMGNMATNNSPAFDIKKCLRDPKNPSSGIDPAKWAQYSQKLR